MNCHDM